MSISISEKRLAFIFFLLLSLSFFSASTAEAAVTIKRGTATQNIWWQIAGPAASCVKGINVISGGPTSGVDVQWQTPPSAPAPSGSVALGPWNNAGVYDFTCTPAGFPPGVDRITVNDCPFYGEVWNGSNACVAASAATISVTPPTNVTVGGAGTLSWTTTGATSIDINTCSGPAAAAWTQIGINGASLPNGSKNVTATLAMVGVTTCSAVQAFGPGGPSVPQSFTWTVTGASCPLPWGGPPLAHGSSVTAYQSPSVVAPGSCVSESRTCNNGSLSGTYANQSCVVTPLGAPIGTLSAASPTCTVPLGGTLCPIDFTWTTTNPVGTSIIWRDDLGIGTPITSGNNSIGPTPFNVRYAAVTGNGTRTFHLSHGGIDIAAPVAVTANCSAGESWSAGGVCTAAATLPTLSSPTHTSITTTGATLGADLTGTGGSAVTARGTCWGTTNPPLINCTPDGSTALGVFTQARTGMSSATTIYYRGYADNGVGRGYSPVSSFVTLAPSAPSLTFTASPGSIPVGNSSTLTWTVTGTADSCWASGGWGGAWVAFSGTNNSPVSPVVTTSYNLECWNAGVSSGLQSVTVTVTAAATLPTLSSPTHTSITTTDATLGANLTGDGGNPVTARGTCWGTTNPPLTNCVADASTALGVFAQARTGMPSATTIYYRGYATNGVGTGYSPVSSFVTLAVAVACTGLPSDASYHPGDDPGVLGNSTAAYSATNNAPYCEFICGTGAGGYTWSGGVCRPPQINYFRICDDAAGTIGCVNPSDPAKSVNVGDTVYTHWDSSYTDECNASAGPADFSTSLQTTGVDSNVISAAPGTPQTYSVRCTKNLNAVSSSNRTITININLLNPTLTSSQSVVKVGSSVTLTWDSNNTPAGVNEGVCGLTGGGLVGYNPLPVGGDLEMGTTNPITISGRTTFTLTCPSGTAIKTVDVIPQNGET